MKNKIIFMFILVLMTAVFSLVTYAAEDYCGYMVSFKEGFSPSETVSLMSTDAPRVDIVNEDKNVYTVADDEALQYYLSQGVLESYEPNYIAELHYTPTDKYYNQTYQKYLWKLNVQTAWNMGCYGNDVKIGIIDSGISKHPDIVDALAGGKNCVAAEIKEDASNVENYYDTLGHGTTVAGIIAAQFNTSYMAGIAPKAKLYALKCTSTGSGIKYDDIIACIYAAIDEFDCDIINMSLGGSSYSSNFNKAIQYAYNKGVIVCSSVGNDGDTTNQITYPSGFSNIIAVGSVDYNDEHCTYSRINSSVDVCAYGGNKVSGQWLYNLTKNSGYTGTCGTSFACPQVVAAAALAKCIDPDITPYGYLKLLQDTVTDLGTSGRDNTFGYGALNIDAMMKKLIEDYDLYVSPITKWSESRYDINIYNNTDSAANLFTLWKNESPDGVALSEIEPGSYDEITLDSATDDVTAYLIDKLSLKPILKKSFK